MTLTVELTANVEARLAAKAKAQGIPLPTYISSVLEEIAASEESSELRPKERARLWREWVEKCAVGGPPLSDELISRESLYRHHEE